MLLPARSLPRTCSHNGTQLSSRNARSLPPLTPPPSLAASSSPSTSSPLAWAVTCFGSASGAGSAPTVLCDVRYCDSKRTDLPTRCPVLRYSAGRSLLRDARY
eukprot:68683-Rhodomonas_salina.1